MIMNEITHCSQKLQLHHDFISHPMETSKAKWHLVCSSKAQLRRTFITAAKLSLKGIHILVSG